MAESLRSHFQGRLLDALVQMAETYEKDGDKEGAIRALLRGTSLDPYAEHIYRRVMNAYAKLGRASDIKRVYQELEAALPEGLDAEPAEETLALKVWLLGNLIGSRPGPSSQHG
jgi:DNA-binding SARP family transcriptional activator